MLLYLRDSSDSDYSGDEDTEQKKNSVEPREPR